MFDELKQCVFVSSLILRFNCTCVLHNFIVQDNNNNKKKKTMKAITAVCANGASAPTITNGRISRHRDGENDEIQMYLSKLKDLVPNMPKNKKISKLEVIQNVIDYICDLQRALETTSNSSAISNFDASAVLCESLSPRQPLGVRSSPNTILLANSTSDTNAVR